MLASIPSESTTGTPGGRTRTQSTTRTTTLETPGDWTAIDEMVTERTIDGRTYKYAGCQALRISL